MSNRLFVEDYLPRSELVVPKHPVPRARFTAVEAHNHITFPRFGWTERDTEQTLRELEALNVQTVVNLSGSWGDELKRNLASWDLCYPGRFVSFCNVDFTGLGSTGWTERTVAQFRADIAAGAKGLKIYKELGLRHRDVQGRLVLPNDARLFDLWEQAAELGVPVLIHTADPRAFFRPLDRLNERWDELHRRPEWMFYGPEFPSFEELIDSLYQLIEAHPHTTFITAHAGCHPENLVFVGEMLDKYPNMYTDFSARIAELGRAPYTARAWFLKHSDRILFGTDSHYNPATYQIYFRFLETADEYFPYNHDSPIPRQGRWCIYGVYLPDEVLRKVYHDNAARLLHLS